MKTAHYAFLLLLIAVALAACSRAESTETTPAAELSVVSPQDEAALDVTSLALGILALANTEHAVHQEQAAELLPLWQQVRAFSDSSASAELQSLSRRIVESLTGTQRESITLLLQAPTLQDEIAAQYDLALPGTGGAPGSGMSPGGATGFVEPGVKASAGGGASVEAAADTWTGDLIDAVILYLQELETS